MTINIIVSVVNYKNNLCIGRNGNLLVKLTQDLKYFKNITEERTCKNSKLNKNVVLMGRKTWFSIPRENRPLKNRINLVLTNDKELLKLSPYPKSSPFRKEPLYDKNVYFITFDQFDHFYETTRANTFVIGGGEIYKIFQNSEKYKPSNLFITEIYDMPKQNIEPDTFINAPDETYRLISFSEKMYESNISFRFLEYKFYTGYLTDESKYLNLLRKIISSGDSKQDRTNIGTISIFGDQLSFDISQSIPLFTTKRVAWKSCIQELLWFLRGDTDAKILQSQDVHIWDGNTSREFLDNRGLKHYPEGVLGPCFPKGTMVLTDSGYKCIEDVTYNDALYTHTGKWGKIEQLMKRNYKGEIIRFKVRYQPFVETTPEHPVFARTFQVEGRNNRVVAGEPQWVEAKELTKQHLIGLKINKSNTIPEFNINIKGKIYKKVLDNIDEWWMFGLFLGDGWLVDENVGGTIYKRIYFVMNNKQHDYIKSRLDKVFNNLQLKSVDTTYITYRCSQKSISEILSYFGKYAHKKCIPDWVHCAPKEYIKEFLDGYWTADGCYRKNNPNIKRFTTVSPDIALSVQRLYLKLGKLCSVRKQDRTGYTSTFLRRNDKLMTYNNKDCYELEVYTNRRRNNYSYIDENYAWFQVCKTETIQNVDKDVYNFSVIGDNTYTVNNIAVHNCYGWQWRFFGAKYSQAFADTSQIDTTKIGGFDQLAYVEHLLKTEPFSRRIMMCYWNPPDFDKMALLPCHFSCQFYVVKRQDDLYLSCSFNMRSNDMFLGNPFNVFSYAVLTYILALRCNMKPDRLIYSVGDSHIYKNHLLQVAEQLSRSPRPFPKLILNQELKTRAYNNISIDDFDIVGYFPHPPIRAPMAI